MQKLAHELLRRPAQKDRCTLVDPQHAACRVADQQRRSRELEDALEVVFEEPVLLDLASEVRHQEGVLEGQGGLLGVEGVRCADVDDIDVAAVFVAVTVGIEVVQR